MYKRKFAHQLDYNLIYTARCYAERGYDT